jgi:ubiquinone/menaquinone biosynthesis C-methylase UbiE
MKISKRFKHSTFDFSVLSLLLLDIAWWNTWVVSSCCTLYFLGGYFWHRREARLNFEASQHLRAEMTLASIKEIERTYTLRDDYNTPEKRALVRPPLDRHFYHQRYTQVQRLLDRYARDARTILDVGCGFGKNTAYIGQTHGRRALGIDIDSLKLMEARRRFGGGGQTEACSFICADAARPPFRASTFDCILITEVLEHLISPSEALNACRTLLCNGGWLIITTPGSHNLNYSGNPFVVAEKLLSLLSDAVLPPYHDLHAEREFNRRKPEPQYGIHYHFSVRQLDGLLRDAGFETITHGSFEFEIYPYLLIELLTGGNLESIAKWVSPIEAVLQSIPAINRLGQHLLWVARKPPGQDRSLSVQLHDLVTSRNST